MTVIFLFSSEKEKKFIYMFLVTYLYYLGLVYVVKNHWLYLWMANIDSVYIGIYILT